jgi:hypothetical protein
MGEEMDMKDMLASATKSTAKVFKPKRKTRGPNKVKKVKAASTTPKKRRKRKPTVTKKVRGKQYRVDLRGDPIVPYNKKPINKLCQRCQNDCTQTAEVILIHCPYFKKVGAE